MKTSGVEICKKYGIGLTGGIACGKTTVGKMLVERGFIVIDADQLARKAVQRGSKGLAKIAETFGGSVLGDDGNLNRKQMGELVFSDAEQRKKLEAIVHPIIQELLMEALAEQGLLDTPRNWFYEASLLFETGRNQDFRQMWVVTCPKHVQIARLAQRDSRERRQLEKIIETQMAPSEKAALADVVIDTHCSLDDLDTRVRLALQRLPGQSGIMKLQTQKR